MDHIANGIADALRLSTGSPGQTEGHNDIGNGNDMSMERSGSASGIGNGHTGIYQTFITSLSEPTQEELENELPVVYDGQVELGELLSRIVQNIYAELTEMAETLPNMSDVARKRTIADWVVKTKKQIVKLFAVVKWSRDAGDVQKAMNITAFLMDQNRQFEEAIHGITQMKESLAPARLRNHDILTSLDVLTTGTYTRLPSAIKKIFIPPPPLTDTEIEKTFRGMEDVMRYRLRMHDIIPVEMSRYEIAIGQTFFTVPRLFKTSVSLRGAQESDGWFFVHVEFLHSVKEGGSFVSQEFPRKPVDEMKRYIADEADLRLGCYLPLPATEDHSQHHPQSQNRDSETPQPPESQPPPKPRLPPGTVDAPLVRLYNFLQMLSLTYQLEILYFQAQAMRSLGWGEYLTLRRSRDSKSFMVEYWIRPNTTRTQHSVNRPHIPPLGGKLTISIVETHSHTNHASSLSTSSISSSVKAGSSISSSSGPKRTPTDRILVELELRSKLSGGNVKQSLKPSDEIETYKIDAEWEPEKAPGALGVVVPADFFSFSTVDGEGLDIDSQSLDFESVLRKVISKHIYGILRVYQYNLQNGPYRAVFSPAGEVVLKTENNISSLHVHLCADEFIVVSIDPRTGRLTLRDTGDLTASGKGPRCAIVSEKLNENPLMIYEALIRLRYNTIIELAEQKANYLGLQSFRTRNFAREEMIKWGPSVRAQLFIQLANFRLHYLVLVATDVEFRYALIEVSVVEDNGSGMQGAMKILDIAWLDVGRICGDEGDGGVGEDEHVSGAAASVSASMQKNEVTERGNSFKLDTSLLRELYAYCCARVSHTRVELQLKLRQIPYTRVNPIINEKEKKSFLELGHIQSSLARSVPGLCVQASDILAGAPAAEAAMPNIRVIPLNWWAEKKSQVVMCVKLKYVQQPIGKHVSGAAKHESVIRPSKRIIYDTREAVVSFLSENVDTCVDEFLEEWAKVSKMVVIAREVTQMAKANEWDDVRLLSFDLQTVEFVYAKDYAISITCTDQQLISTSATYEISFSRVPSPSSSASTSTNPLAPSSSDSASKAEPSIVESTDIDGTPINPHADVEPFLRKILCHGRLTNSLHELVSLLRQTLDIAVELQDAKRRYALALKNTDSKENEGDENDEEDEYIKKWKGHEKKIRVLVIPKSASWYRILHALDIRIIPKGRVLMIDASYPLYRNYQQQHNTSTTMPQDTSPPKSVTPTPPQFTQTPTPRPTPKKPTTFSSDTISQMNNEAKQELGVFQPIPDIRDIVCSAIYDAAHIPGIKLNGVAEIDVGLVCVVEAVPLLVQPLHDRIVLKLAMALAEKEEGKEYLGSKV